MIIIMSKKKKKKKEEENVTKRTKPHFHWVLDLKQRRLDIKQVAFIFSTSKALGPICHKRKVRRVIWRPPFHPSETSCQGLNNMCWCLVWNVILIQVFNYLLERTVMDFCLWYVWSCVIYFFLRVCGSVCACLCVT